MRILKTKRSALLAVIGVLSLSAVAFAWLSTTGSGSGSGTVTASAVNLDLTSDAPVLTATDDTAEINIYAANTGDSASNVGGVTAVPTPVNDDCNPASFTISNPTETGDQVPADSTGTVVATATVTFVNLDEDQDACLEGLTIDLDATA